MEYLKLFDFAGLNLDDAVRVFLYHLSLPGESGLIDRLVDCFGQWYFLQNPDSFPSDEMVYVVCFAIIMLNTDLHNPLIHKKMSKEQFLLNLSLPELVSHACFFQLGFIYDRILATPIANKGEERKIAERNNEEKGLLTSVYEYCFGRP